MKLNTIRLIYAKLTRTERYVPDFTWSSKCWTFNFFRAYEFVFGRKIGIKLEVTAGAYYDERSCKWKGYQIAHTFEASLTILEGQIRRLFSFQLPQLIYVPLLQTNTGVRFSDSPYLLAVAYDNLGQSTTGFGSGAITWNHTTAGSDRVIFISSAKPDSGAWGAGMTVTYNSVTVNEIGHKSVSNGTTDWNVGLFGLVAPAVGTNVCSVTSSNTLGGCSTSYSGVSQTSLPDSFAEVNSGGSSVTSLNFSTTVVAANSWLVLGARSMSGTALSAGTSTTLRGYAFMPTNKYIAICDSNGPVAAGSRTLQVTGASQRIGGVIASFAPAGPSTTIKTINGVLKSNVKTINSVAIASVKSWDNIQ